MAQDETYDGYISYNENKFPYKSINLQDNDYQPSYILVSIKPLEDILVDENGVAYNKEAEHLDNMISYYLESAEDFKRSRDSILNEIYS